MESVSVRLVGGLGNQMFQYAAARAVALRNQVPLTLDLSWFGTDPDRQFALSPFNIDAMLMSANGVGRGKASLLDRIERRLRRIVGWPSGGVPVYAERSFRFDPAIHAVKAPVALDGYFQSALYFEAIREQIAQDFTLREAAEGLTADMLDCIVQSDAICVHIRRGDYVSNSAANAYHGTCSLAYYRDGLELVRQGLDSPHCFVFSDDPDWVKANFRSELPVTVVDIHGTEQAHEDLRLMSGCRRFVIANSSLSWWAAWLGSANDKRVVAPMRWFSGGDNDTTDLIPADWLRV